MSGARGHRSATEQHGHVLPDLSLERGHVLAASSEVESA